MERKNTKHRSKDKIGNVAGAICNDKECSKHGNLKARGKTFEGTVIKKFPRRVVIEFERMIYIRKYERYARSKTKIHARLPECMENQINKGDYIKIMECRPLSKLIHFVVIEKIKDNSEVGGNSK
jgi:small subunit ribosomal protein S17